MGLKGDGIGTAGHTAAGYRSVFVVISGGEAVGDGLTVCSNTFEGVLCATAVGNNRSGETFGRGPGYKLGFCDVEFPSAEEWIGLRE